jgi:glycosyltransferase involved in cell wall biosynthesis
LCAAPFSPREVTLRRVSARKKVLVITIDPAEAAFRLRLGILPQLLSDDGYDFDFHTRPPGFWDRRKLIATAAGYHAVIVQRKLLDPSHARLLRRRARLVIFELDDAVMVQRRKISRWSQWLKDRRFRATARATDHVVAGNDYLAGQFKPFGCRTTVLPTVVDPAHYRTKVHADMAVSTLVWIGSGSTLPYLLQAMPAIEAAAKKIGKLKLITIADRSVTSDIVEVEHAPWSLETEADALARGDIGIAPTPKDQWTAGKSGFKIIQYMATGLPTIASPVGANAAIITNGVDGILPATDDDWPDAIVRLATDTAVRREMGIAARKTVERLYTLDRAAEAWRNVLSGS